MTDDRQLPDDFHDWNGPELQRYSDKTGIPLDELRAAQWERIELRRRFRDLKRATTAREILEFPYLVQTKESPEFLDRLPMMDGQQFNELLDEEEEIDAKITKLKQRKMAIRDEIADEMGRDCRFTFSRRHISSRGRENLRSDIATIILMSWLGALGMAKYWARAMGMINGGEFGWKPGKGAKLFRHKMRKE